MAARPVRRPFANQVRQMTDAIASHFPEGKRVTRPLGGFVVWAELPGEIDTMQLYDAAVQPLRSAPSRRSSSSDDWYAPALE
jgi:DNA-binding transcriptional MocR family regulator